ncbi:MAG TPA: PAS-domain containing protein [Rhizomicrobium sp.]|nr:PAS-domain containing protein [Rhizomicrobium sp.]
MTIRTSAAQLIPQAPAIHPAADGASMMMIVAICAIVLGLIVSIAAIWLYVKLADQRRQSQTDLRHADGQIAFRDALLATGSDSVVVLTPGAQQPKSADGANALLMAAMDGPDSKRVAGALGALTQEGRSFDLMARSSNVAEIIAIRGRTVAGRAVAYARNMGPAVPALDYNMLLDAVPAPVWVRGSDLALRWGNQAFLEAAEAPNLQAALTANASLQDTETDLFAAVIDSGADVEATRYALVDGERRAYSLKFVRLPDSSVAGFAVDMTERARAEGRLRLHVEATADMLEGVPGAIAKFDSAQKLESFNSAYAKLSGIDEKWLDTHPTLGDVLDRLRAARKLPEQQDYAAWKAAQLKLFEMCFQRHEEFWHLADGQSLKISVRPHLLGGLVFTIEDISEKLRLESSFNLLVQVQRAMLDTMEDAIAIFGPDGRLALSNTRFAQLWNLSEEELQAQPHFTKVATLAEARKGRDGIWGIVSAGIVSAEPERCNDWGRAVRADGRTISLSMARLPNGATIATFSDLTDVQKFQQAQLEAPHVAA